MKVQKVKLQMVIENTKDCQETIKAPIDAVNFINKYERYDLAPTENLIVIGLNIRNKIIYSQVSMGGVNSSFITPADIFKALLVSNCSKFILVHNHPSGDATPSKEDIELTKNMNIAAGILGLTLLDHIIIGNNNYTSIMSKKEAQ